MGGAALGEVGSRDGGVYAMKILIPPSSFSLFFRNLLYTIGFQAPFQQQVNPAAARAGVGQSTVSVLLRFLGKSGS